MPLLPVTLTLSILFLAGCASDETPSGPTEPRLATAADPTLAPHPFTAEQIRAGTPVGMILVQRTETRGQAPAHTRLEVIGTSDTGGAFETATVDDEGRAVGPVTRFTSSWTELRDHATFPQATTKISETTTRVPAGAWDCWLYVVEAPEGETRYHFAKSLPGAPIRCEVIRDAEIVTTVSLESLVLP